MCCITPGSDEIGFGLVVDESFKERLHLFRLVALGVALESQDLLARARVALCANVTTVRMVNGCALVAMTFPARFDQHQNQHQLRYEQG